MEDLLALRKAFNHELLVQMQGKFASSGMAGLAHTILWACFIIGLFHEFRNVDKKSFLHGFIRFITKAWLVLALMYGGKYVGQVSLIGRMVDGSTAPMYISAYNKVSDFAKELEAQLADGADEAMLAYNTNQLMTFQDNLATTQMKCDMADTVCVESYLRTGSPPSVSKIKSNTAQAQPETSLMDKIASATLKLPVISAIYESLIEFKNSFLAFFMTPGSIVLPVLQWALGIIASALNFGLLLFWGIAIAFSILLTQVFTPFLMIKSFESQVKGMYKTFFSTAFYGFIMKLIIWISNIIMASMVTVTKDMMVQKIIEWSAANSLGAFGSGRAQLQMFMMATFMTSFAVIAMQITAMAKVPSMAQKLMNLSIETFVNLGETLMQGGLAFAQMTAVTGITAAAAVASGGTSLAKTALGKMGGSGGSSDGASAGNMVEKGATNAGKAAGKGAEAAGKAAGKGVELAGKMAGGGLKAAGSAMQAIPVVGSILGGMTIAAGTGVSAAGSMAGKAIETTGKVAGKGMETAGKVAGQAGKTATKTAVKGANKGGSILKKHFGDEDEELGESKSSNPSSSMTDSSDKKESKPSSGNKKKKKEGFLSKNFKPTKMMTSLTNAAFDNAKVGAGGGGDGLGLARDTASGTENLFKAAGSYKHTNEEKDDSSSQSSPQQDQIGGKTSVDSLSRSDELLKESKADHSMNDNEQKQYNELQEKIQLGSANQKEMENFEAMNNKHETSEKEKEEYEKLSKNNLEFKAISDKNKTENSKLESKMNQEMNEDGLSEDSVSQMKQQIDAGKMSKSVLKDEQMKKSMEEFSKKQQEQIEAEIRSMKNKQLLDQQLDNSEKKTLLKLATNNSIKSKMSTDTLNILNQLVKNIK